MEQNSEILKKINMLNMPIVKEVVKLSELQLNVWYTMHKVFKCKTR